MISNETGLDSVAQNVENAAKAETATPGPEPAAVDPAPKRPVVAISDTAMAEICRLRDKRGLAEISLRIGVKAGGCAGLSYSMSFDEGEIKPTDHVTQLGGVKLVVDRKSAIFLRGMVLNYSDDLIGGGFKFENPNARRSCSCGSSFSA